VRDSSVSLTPSGRTAYFQGSQVETWAEASSPFAPGTSGLTTGPKPIRSPSRSGYPRSLPQNCKVLASNLLGTIFTNNLVCLLPIPRPIERTGQSSFDRLAKAETFLRSNGTAKEAKASGNPPWLATIARQPQAMPSRATRPNGSFHREGKTIVR
jgi:hypothetical protein